MAEYKGPFGQFKLQIKLTTFLIDGRLFLNSVKLKGVAFSIKFPP